MLVACRERRGVKKTRNTTNLETTHRLLYRLPASFYEAKHQRRRHRTQVHPGRHQNNTWHNDQHRYSQLLQPRHMADLPSSLPSSLNSATYKIGLRCEHVQYSQTTTHPISHWNHSTSSRFSMYSFLSMYKVVYISTELAHSIFKCNHLLLFPITFHI